MTLCWRMHLFRTGISPEWCLLARRESILSVFAWALMGFGNVYYGLARRALDQSIATVKSKGSLALSRSMASHPEIQHAIAEMVIELESIGPHLEKVAEDWSSGVDHGAHWPSKI